MYTYTGCRCKDYVSICKTLMLYFKDYTENNLDWQYCCMKRKALIVRIKSSMKSKYNSH